MRWPIAISGEFVALLCENVQNDQAAIWGGDGVGRGMVC